MILKVPFNCFQDLLLCKNSGLLFKSQPAFYSHWADSPPKAWRDPPIESQESEWTALLFELLWSLPAAGSNLSLRLGQQLMSNRVCHICTHTTGWTVTNSCRKKWSKFPKHEASACSAGCNHKFVHMQEQILKERALKAYATPSPPHMVTQEQGSECDRDTCQSPLISSPHLGSPGSHAPASSSLVAQMQRSLLLNKAQQMTPWFSNLILSLFKFLL